MQTPKRKPLVGIPADCRDISGMPFHAVGDKYVRAVFEAADCIPLCIPALGDALDIGALLRRLDGVLLTGSPSNVEPRHYAGAESEPGTVHDPDRDATTLPLIPKALAGGVPLLAICRGFQELNVALGGTLHQKVHLQPGKHDHRENYDDPVNARYALRHSIQLKPGGVLAALAGAKEVSVNSLHAQGIDQLAPGLTVEAVAPDGLVEAFAVRTAPAFSLAVQWHPEWRVMENPFYRAIFHAFGEACRGRARERAALSEETSSEDHTEEELLAEREGC